MRTTYESVTLCKLICLPYPVDLLVAEQFTMTLARKNGLRLAYATPEDAEAIAPLFALSFHDHAYFRRMLPDSPESRLAWADVFRFACKDPYTICLKVTDEKTDKIVSHGRWVEPKKQVEDEQPGHEEERWSALDPYLDAETADALFGAFAKNRQEKMEERRHYCKSGYHGHVSWYTDTRTQRHGTPHDC